MNGERAASSVRINQVSTVDWHLAQPDRSRLESERNEYHHQELDL
jgi:hypothetical protein